VQQHNFGEKHDVCGNITGVERQRGQKKDKPGGGSHRALEKREEGFNYGVLG
jgi:hypothetical protein